MRPLFHLDSMLSQYQPVFNYNNFTHFQTYVKGLIDTPHRGTMTQIYQSTRPPNSYWALAKFLSRSKWDIDEVTSVLLEQVLETELGQGKNKKFVYVYDESHSTTDGTKQHGLHYYINTRYNGRNKNQSKFHHGHQFGAIGWLCETPEGVELFPLAARVMCPGEEKDTSQEVLSSLCDKVPPGAHCFLIEVSIDAKYLKKSIHKDMMDSVAQGLMLCLSISRNRYQRKKGSEADRIFMGVVCIFRI